MDLVDKFDAQIDAYIRNSMNAAEKLDFERVLKDHPVLQEELSLRRSLKNGLEQIEVADVRSRLKEIKKTKSISTSKTNNTTKNTTKTSTQEQAKESTPWLKYLLLFISLAALLFLAKTFFAPSDTPVKSNMPMASYFEPMPLQISDRGSQEDEIKEMSALYNSKEYTKVIPYLDKFLIEKEDVKWNLYRGVAHYAVGDYTKASMDFEKVAISDNYLLKDHGTWYQALAAQQLGNIETAKELLKTLASNPKADHAKEAAELLSKL